MSHIHGTPDTGPQETTGRIGAPPDRRLSGAAGVD